MTSDKTVDSVDFFLRSLVSDIRSAALAVLQELGPKGDFQLYQECFKIELTQREVPFIVGDPLPYFYKGVRVEGARYDKPIIIASSFLVKPVDTSFSGFTMDMEMETQNDLSTLSLSHAAIVDFFAPNRNDIIKDVVLED